MSEALSVQVERSWGAFMDDARSSVYVECHPFQQLRSLSSGGVLHLVSVDDRSSRALFAAAYALYILAAGWNATTFVGWGTITKGDVCGLLQALAAVFFLAKLITQRYALKQLLILLIAGAVAVTTVVVSHDFGALWIVILVASCQGIELQFAALVTCLATLTVIVLAALGMMMGLCPAVFAQRGNTGAIRYSMGFSHTNLFANNVAVVGVAWFVSRLPRARVADVLVLAVSATVIYVVTNARTTTIAVLFIMVIAVLCVLLHRAPSPYLAIGLFSAAALVSLGLMLLYQHLPMGVRSELNYVLSDRPYYFHSYFKQLGLSLFGGDLAQAHVWHTNPVTKGLALDNSYVSLLLGKGVVVFGAVFASLCACAARARRDMRYVPFLFALTFFAVVGFAENIANSIAMNFSLACIAYLLYGVPVAANRYDASLRIEHGGGKRGE